MRPVKPVERKQRRRTTIYGSGVKRGKYDEFLRCVAGTRTHEAVSKLAADRCPGVAEHHVPPPPPPASSRRLDIPPPVKVREPQTVKEAPLDRCRAAPGTAAGCCVCHLAPTHRCRWSNVNCETQLAGESGHCAGISRSRQE